MSTQSIFRPTILAIALAAAFAERVPGDDQHHLGEGEQ